MTAINEDVRDIIDELDADGSGFQTGEASRLLVHRYVSGGICTEDGDPKPKVRTLMQMGAGVAVKNYRAVSVKAEAVCERAAARSGLSQGDFLELSDDFSHRWLLSYAAYEEGEDAERKMLIRMTLSEVQAVIALKQKKAAEAIAVANRLQQIVDTHPRWAKYPELSIAEVLGIHERG